MVARNRERGVYHPRADFVPRHPPPRHFVLFRADDKCADLPRCEAYLWGVTNALIMREYRMIHTLVIALAQSLALAYRACLRAKMLEALERKAASS